MEVTSQTKSKITNLIAMVAVLFPPVWFGGKGLFAFLTGDDFMNLYGYWSKPFLATLQANFFYFSSFYRPLGGLAYLGLYSTFGLNPLPFRLACFAIFFFNLFLLYKLALTLTGSKETALLTTLFGSHHGGYFDYYFNTGTIYDLLCYTFFSLGLYLYITKSKVLYVVLCFICALNAKEMGVTFPAVILAYELIFHWPGFGIQKMKSWFIERGFIPLLLVLLLVPYVISKLSAASIFSGNQEYKLDLSMAQYLANSIHYLDLMLYYNQGWATIPILLGFMLGMVFIALAFQSRILIFSTFFALITPLPILFIHSRGSIFVLYIPMIGFTLYLATLLVLLRDKFFSNVPWRRPITFSIVYALFFWWHAKNAPFFSEITGIRQTVNQLSALNLNPKVGARILLLDDPFGKDEWMPLFIGRLLYHDQELIVDRIKMMDKKPTVEEIKSYDFVLNYQTGQLKLVGK